MSVAEMKLEVISKIATVNNEAVLKEVLSLLEDSSSKADDVISLANTYDQIKNQYADVLQKLAE